MKKYVTLFLLLLFGIVDLNAQCTTVGSISEKFDASKSIPSCWDSQSGLSMIYVKNQRITFYSLMTPKQDMYLITPKLKAGTYTLTLDASANEGKTFLELFSISNPSNEKSFLMVVKASEIKGGKRTQTFRLKKDAHVGIKVLLDEMHQAVYVDNIMIQPRR